MRSSVQWGPRQDAPGTRWLHFSHTYHTLPLRVPLCSWQPLSIQGAPPHPSGHAETLQPFLGPPVASALSIHSCITVQSTRLPAHPPTLPGPLALFPQLLRFWASLHTEPSTSAVAVQASSRPYDILHRVPLPLKQLDPPCCPKTYFPPPRMDPQRHMLPTFPTGHLIKEPRVCLFSAQCLPTHHQ